jgi:hypothetical protein
MAMIKLGSSQRRIHAWLASQKVGQTAAEIGAALYDSVSSCGSPEHPERYPQKVKTGWARKMLTQMVKNGSALIIGTKGTANTYTARTIND